MKKVKKWFWYFFHNCLCHPLLPFLPKKLGNRLHDWSAEFIWPSEKKLTDSFLIEIPKSSEDHEYRQLSRAMKKAIEGRAAEELFEPFKSYANSKRKRTEEG